jgi:hypothetical protein
MTGKEFEERLNTIYAESCKTCGVPDEIKQLILDLIGDDEGKLKYMRKYLSKHSISDSLITDNKRGEIYEESYVRNELRKELRAIVKGNK